MKIAVIFYKGKPDWQDRLIRFFTGGKYSHCEIRLKNGNHFGVSPTYNKVCKYVKTNFNENDWDSVEVEISKKDFDAFFDKTRGKKYDWKGIFFSQILPFKLHSKNKYFCSEWVAELLGISKPHRYSPNKLYKYLRGF